MKVACIGAGPAGLTAGYLLSKKNISVTVFEADPKYVGGISKTVKYNGYYFDIGGHRFFSKSQEVEDLWTELLDKDMLERPRSSKIYYRRKYFSYPLKAFEALFNLGIFESILCVLSYIKVRIFPHKNPKTFEQWVTNQFGKRLFNIFFKTYTEKVWGMKCSEISADWAAQRIKGLSLSSAIYHALIPQKKNKNKQDVIKTLIDSFRYPKYGPGMLWESAAQKILQMGNQVLLGHKVTRIELTDDSTWLVTHKNQLGMEKTEEYDHVISSTPIKYLINNLYPVCDLEIVKAANNLKYRDFLTVAIMIKDEEKFSDNWIYIHDPNVLVGRIQNFKSWSPYLVPDQSTTCYGLEYFCFEGDDLWDKSDEELIELAKKELIELQMIKGPEVIDGHVVRQKKAYPVYDDDYQKNVDLIRNNLESQYPNLHLVGRNGMHKYNNQDHAMMTSMLTVENILNSQKIFDVWNVNQDAQYHESGKFYGKVIDKSMLRDTPKHV